MAALPGERIVVIDETSMNLALTRRYARAPRGQRAVGRVPRNQGKNVSGMGALGLHGIVTSMAIEGAVDTAVFNTFVTRLLGPTLRAGDIVVLDNLRVHHSSRIEQAVHAIGGQVCFLPPYSPDLSPIEPCWAKGKTSLRHVGARTPRRLFRAWRHALRTVTPTDIRGWFRHCGYSVIPN